MNKGDSISEALLVHPILRDKEGCAIIVRIMSDFFETFPVILVHKDVIIRADAQLYNA